jgi:heme-degrading monooxygenase HmoA
MRFHLAQVNIARMKAPLESAVMAGFVARLEEINQLADRSPGFVWRLQSTAGDNTYLRPYEDDRILFNLSVWESVDDLRAYAYRSAHVELLKQKQDWFNKFAGAWFALWWLPAGELPSVDEAKKRLAHLEAHGPSPFAFTFRVTFPPDEAEIAAVDRTTFEPCPAV